MPKRVARGMPDLKAKITEGEDLAMDQNYTGTRAGINISKTKLGSTTFGLPQGQIVCMQGNRRGRVIISNKFPDPANMVEVGMGKPDGL